MFYRSIVPRIAFRTDAGSWTHEQVHDGAGRLAMVLAARGVRPGGRVLVILPDGVAFVETFLALASALGTTCEALLTEP